MLRKKTLAPAKVEPNIYSPESLLVRSCDEKKKKCEFFQTMYTLTWRNSWPHILNMDMVYGASPGSYLPVRKKVSLALLSGRQIERVVILSERDGECIYLVVGDRQHIYLGV